MSIKSSSDLILNQLFSLFLELNLSWNAALREQFETAQISFENCASSWFFDFRYEQAPTPVPTAIRVPIAVEICKKIIVTGIELHALFGQARAYWLDETSPCATAKFFANPSGRLLGVYPHFSKGVLFELEVVDWDAGIIDAAEFLQDISQGERMYSIRDAKIVDELTNRTVSRC